MYSFSYDNRVEREISRLKVSEEVEVARKYAKFKEDRREYLSYLRGLEREGAELLSRGITCEKIESMYDAEGWGE